MKDIDPEVLALYEQYGDSLEIFADAEECERDLAVFFRRAWPIIDPAPYVHGFIHDAIADHLMAVSDGHVKKLLINVPFRTGKTNLVSVAWQVWTWIQGQRGPRMGPQVKFLCLSYASSLSERSATTARNLIASKWFQDRWGHRVKIDPRQDNKGEFATIDGGARISLGLDGGTMGRGGDVKLLDDPHTVSGAESEIQLGSTIQTYDEAISSRFTDPESSAEVIIMQRLHMNDLSGHVLDKMRGFVHLCLPMMYDPARHCTTYIGEQRWDDPRGLDENGDMLEGMTPDGKIIPNSPLAHAEGKLLWPQRFSQKIVDDLMSSLGPYSASGQLQQSPTPRGGGIIKGEWWKLWRKDAYPDFRYVLVSVDTAQTEKEQNDEAGITVWGIFDGDASEGTVPQVMLINAWEGRLELNPLVMKIAEFCKKHNADTCLIESKSNGIDVINEIRRLFGRRVWSTIPFDPGNRDKVSRLYSVQSQFSGEHKLDPTTGKRHWIGGIVWAPDKDFAQLTIDRVSAFPKTKMKAIPDTVSQAMKWMRDGGLMLTHEERAEDIEEEMRYQKPKRPLYDV